MKKIYIDLETTGPKHWIHGVHQISGIIKAKGEINPFDFKVRPFGEDIVDPKALEACNITIERIAKYPKAHYVWDELHTLLKQYINPFDKKDKFICYAYNAPFDESFFRSWLIKQNFLYFGSFFHSPLNCVMQKALVVLGYDRNKLNSNSLSDTCRYFGIEIDESRLHDAIYDVELTVKLDEELDKRLEKGISYF